MNMRFMIVSVSVSLLLLIAGCSSTYTDEELLDVEQSEPVSGEEEKEDPEMNHLTTSNTVGDVVTHPAFKGFGNYILPLERGYNPDMRLSNIASLLPYHNYVDAERAVGYINEMIDRCSRGDKLFYDLGREDAGLFFFPGKPGAPFAVFCPGGGFSYVGSIHEGFPLALELGRWATTLS